LRALNTIWKAEKSRFVGDEPNTVSANAEIAAKYRYERDCKKIVIPTNFGGSCEDRLHQNPGVDKNESRSLLMSYTRLKRKYHRQMSMLSIRLQVFRAVQS
jgi:hypothetical protein